MSDMRKEQAVFHTALDGSRFSKDALESVQKMMSVTITDKELLAEYLTIHAHYRAIQALSIKALKRIEALTASGELTDDDIKWLDGQKES